MKQRDITSVTVTPLQPPFSGKITHISFSNFDKELAVNEHDGQKLKALFANGMTGRTVRLESDGKGKIRVSVVQ